MKDMNELIAEMDFEYLGSGTHAMGVEGMRKNLHNDHYLFLDVRTNEEVAYVSFPFTKHIPLSELPERIAELPKDKCIVAFCSSIFRGAVAFVYLRSQGFAEVKGLTGTMDDMVKLFKPGALYKA